MTNWENIVDEKALKDAAKLRKSPYYEVKDYTSAKEDRAIDGWEAVSPYANDRYTKYRKAKPFDERFEDLVWMMFYNMGFYAMNRDRNFRMVNDPKNPSLTKQIDVFAVEDETIFIIECKASETPRDVNFKTDLEALRGNMENLRKEAMKQYPGRKVLFVWATQGILLGNKDVERLREWRIIHFDDSSVRYYEELTAHLGKAAKYQLLGGILQGQDIRNMSTDVPAIQGQMGTLTYYSFLIEPEKLLKIGYVLHRSRANADMMPTYQRLIKKKRLQEIRKFIDKGGYFPNSIVISIDTNGRKLIFDPAGGSMKVEGTKSRIGILHLPQQYHSAYIIDGQHRLYGYSETAYAGKDCIPVVAFVNLDRAEQLKLFMDINENQKAVSKTLRTTLNKDMFWESEDKAKQRIALRSKIAQELGESSSSPLLSRVMISEDIPETDLCCITIDALQQARGRCRFFSDYGKDNTLKRAGTFDFDNIDTTSDKFFQFITYTLSYIRTHCREQWEKGKTGVLTINRGIQACIRVIDDITSMLIEQKKINPMRDDVASIGDEVTFYLEPLCEYLRNLTGEQESEIKRTYGTNGDLKFYRYFQKPISDAFSDFKPDGLEEFFENQTKKYNDKSREYLFSIETILRKRIGEALQRKFGKNWSRDGVPKDILRRIHNEAFERSLNEDSQVQDWDCTTLKDFSAIATYASNWSTIFEALLTRPQDQGKGRKEEKLSWLDLCDAERSKLAKNQSYSVPRKAFMTIEEVYLWLNQ